MRACTARPILSLLAAITLAACGGDDDGDDGGGGGVDAGDSIPDAGGQPDAGSGVELGAPCDDEGDCSEAYPDCIPLAQGGERYCTKTCGTGQTPPAGGHEACAEGYEGSATAGCIAGLSDGETTTWYCGLACGMAGDTDFGMCPSHMTCNDEDPSDNQSGICMP